MLRRTIVIVPVSASETQRVRGPSAVPVRKGAGGLEKSSVALCHSLTTRDRGTLAERWGTLSKADLAAVEEGIRSAIDW